MSVQRIDVIHGAIENFDKTPQGFLRLNVKATRTGVFKYMNSDGSIRKELRHPDEVFKADSLDSLKNAPLTNDHPPFEFINPSNSNKLMVGMANGDVKRDGIFLKTGAIITNDKAIKDVTGGKNQASCGYRCDHDPTPGTYKGERYDVVQRNIRYNHIAIVDSARAGPEAKFVKDSFVKDSNQGLGIMVIDSKKEDAISHNQIKNILRDKITPKFPANDFVFIVDVFQDHFIFESDQKQQLFKQDYLLKSNDEIELVGEPVEVVKKVEFIKKEDTMEIKIGTITQEVSDEFGERYDALEKERIDAIKKKGELQKKVDVHESESKKQEDEKKKKSKTDSELEAKIDTLKDKVKELTDENKQFKSENSDENLNKKVDGLAKEKMEVLDVAKKVLTEDEYKKTDSMSAFEVKRLILSKKTNRDMKDKTDTYIEARYDSLIEDAKEQYGDQFNNAFGKQVVKDRHDSSNEPKREARLDEWKKPLTASKTK